MVYILIIIIVIIIIVTKLLFSQHSDMWCTHVSENYSGWVQGMMVPHLARPVPLSCHARRFAKENTFSYGPCSAS